MIQPHVEELIEMSRYTKRVKVSAPTVEEIENNMSKILKEEREIKNDSKWVI